MISQHASARPPPFHHARYHNALELQLANVNTASLSFCSLPSPMLEHPPRMVQTRVTHKAHEKQYNTTDHARKSHLFSNFRNAAGLRA